MASFPDLRHGNLSSDSTEGSRVFRKNLAAPAALFHAAAAAFSTPAGRVGLTGDVETGGSWQAYSHGASRSTRLGSETVTVTPTIAEHYQTVTRGQGLRTWRWKLDTTLEPRLSPNGYVGFFRGAELVPLEIDPARILDRHGRNVTPKGLHWGIDQRGRARWLTLRLDDARLPLPYTIDPAAAWRASSTATKVTGTGTWTITTPNTILANDVLVVEQSATVNSTTS